ncbi:tape measure protein [Gordonia rubripertincta]|uniref:Tape measure protein n=1 Tax=Gordonia rubripertincta TaxID=36822 RepID=A0AAW4G9G9_GORRU|nr:tape measure protein [Gordonia rubripertincta]MBM7280371.1 tape measure protein [Gordonia rubripertincta]
MATEIATAYVSILPETSRIAPGIRNALNGAERGASDSGRRMGHTMSTALGTALGIGVSKAAGTASKVLNEAFSAGYNRLNTLEKADIQFRNMGLSAGQTKRQLGDLNNIVTGTSTSLSAAAQAAAMLGGAGVAAGDDMNAAVKAIVNVSAASGAAAEDIGLVMMQIKASGKLMGGDALQLAQRGVPIYDLLAKSIGRTTAEIRTMGEEGKISFEQVVTAINQGTGNLAKEMGETLPAKLANFRTAMGRLSAAGMEPFLLRAKGGVVGLTEAVNTLTPKMKDFALAADAKIFDEWVPKVKAAYGALEDSGAIDQARNTFVGLWDALVDLGPAAKAIAMSLMEAGQSLGVGSWQLFLATVQAASGILQGLTPVLTAVGDLMQAHPGYVTAALAAWLAFRTVPALLGRITTAIAPVTAGVGTMGRNLSGVRPAITGFGDAYRTSLGYIRQANPQISTAGAHIRVLGANAGMAARGGMAALGRGASSVANALGGPLSVGLMAATAGILVATQAHAKAKQGAADQARAVEDLAESQLKMGAAFRESRGAMNDDIWAKASEQLESYSKTLDATAERHSSGWDVAKNIFDMGDHWSGRTSEINAQAESAMAARKAIEDLGLTTDETARAVYGTQGQWMTLEQRLIAMGDGGIAAANDLSQLRFEANQQRDAAARVTPGVSELSEAMQVLGDNTASAAEKSKALKSALDALNPARTKGEAIAKHNEVMRQVAESTKNAIDQTQGFGKSLLDQQLGVNTATKNGAELRQSLMDIIDATSDAASSGADMTERNRLNQEAMAQLAKQYGVSVDEIRSAADKLGMDDVGVAVTLEGAPEVIQQLASISNAWNDTPSKKTITVAEDQVNNDTRAALEEFGLKVSEPLNGTVTITANDDQARAKFLLVTQNVAVLNALKANPNVDLNKLQFDAKNAGVRAELAGLDRTAVSPAAGLVIDDLLRGKQVSMEQLAILSATTSNPQVNLEIAKIMEKIGLVNTQLDQTARTRVANIQPIVLGAAPGTPGGAMGPAMPAGADGLIRRYADGGIHDLEKYANGGALTDPKILPGRGPGSVFVTPAGPAIAAEGETGGEAFIPLGPTKRRRSTDILATVAQMFGFDLVPSGQMPNSISGFFGEMAGGAVSRLMAKTGVDRFRRFADGGITGAELRRLAEGAGASRPLTGAPYVWGGVNWGDCSGAMSAFARAAAGLAPFGGRFTTASMGAQIQQMGGQLGRGGSGDLRFGWYNGGQGGGHTAGTLPDGTNVEMGGGNGGGMMGGSAAGADDPQFTDHAFFPVGSAFDPGSGVPGDEGGWVQRPDGTWVQTGSGNYGASGSGSGSSTSNSISGLFGDAAKAAVGGQVADILEVFGISDTPGVVGAYSEYMNMRNQSQNGSGATVSKEDRERAKAEYDAAKDSLKADYESAKLTRKQDYEQKKQALENDFTLKKIDRATYERKLNELKHAHENDELAKKQEYDSRVAEAKSKYDSATGKAPGAGTTGSDPSATLGLKQKYEDEKLARKQQYDQEKAARKERYEADKKALAEQKLGSELNKQRSDALKAQYDSDLAGMKARYESNELAKKQEYERAAKSVPSVSPGSPRPGVTDPGTVKPRPGEDLGGAGGAPTGNAVKDAFRSGLREGWRQGPPWEATDWIINKESSWNPTATNAESGAFGLPQFLGSTKDQYLPDSSPDPRRQGEAYDAYVGDRYGDPLKAKEHHVNAGWYERGGVIHEGANIMLNGLGHKETALPFDPRDLKASLDRGGAGSPELMDKIDQLITVVAKSSGVTINNPTYRNESEAVRRQQQYVSRQLMRTGG